MKLYKHNKTGTIIEVVKVVKMDRVVWYLYNIVHSNIGGEGYSSYIPNHHLEKEFTKIEGELAEELWRK